MGVLVGVTVAAVFFAANATPAGVSAGSLTPLLINFTIGIMSTNPRLEIHRDIGIDAVPAVAEGVESSPPMVNEEEEDTDTSSTKVHVGRCLYRRGISP